MTEQTDAQRVAGEVRAEMGRQGVRAKDLAAKINVQPSWLSRRLTGRYEFTPSELRRIGDVLGVDWRGLLGSSTTTVVGLTPERGGSEVR